ncbi:Hok/Gef family protein [Photobacterium damselae]|nr:Hok/Gef family protein [Photobacterium damselae]
MPKKVIFITAAVIVITVIVLGIFNRSLCSVEIGGLGLTFKAVLAYES